MRKIISSFVITSIISTTNAYSRSYSIKARTVDKFYIYNFFLDIFGKQNLELLFTKVIKRNDLYGGGCLPYNSTQKKAEFTTNDLNFQDACIKNISEVGEDIFKGIETLRQTHTENICKRLTNKSNNIDYLLSYSGLEKKAVINKINIKEVTSLFFYKEKQIKKYTRILNSKNIESWKNVVFVLCSSPEWQIL